MVIAKKFPFVGQWRAMANLGADRPKYDLGSLLDFTSKGWSALYADHGWYQADPEGTWTVGPVAVLELPLAQPAAGVLHLTMSVMPFLIPQLPARTVHVRLGATDIATWIFGLGEGHQTKEIDLPPGAAATGVLKLTFEIENSISPYALGLSPDSCRRPSVIVIAATIALYPEDLYHQGLTMVTCSTRRTSPAARERSDREFQRLLEEMPLNKLRSALNLTQQSLAKMLNVNQSEISKIENRTDVYVSTLASYLEAMGARLEIRAVFPDGNTIKINQFEELTRT